MPCDDADPTVFDNLVADIDAIRGSIRRTLTANVVESMSRDDAKMLNQTLMELKTLMELTSEALAMRFNLRAPIQYRDLREASHDR